MACIVHIAIANFYREGMGYQENILPIKHIELGYDVYMITRQLDDSVKETASYTNEEGLKVYKLPKNESILRKVPILNCAIRGTKGLGDLLEQLLPDIIFMHGLQAVDNLEVIAYVKKHKAKLYVDQHADFYNTPLKSLKQIIIQRCIYKSIAHKLLPYVSKFWGVTPWRVKYLKEVYGLPEEKIGLLVMGGDDHYINWEERASIRQTVRKEFNIPSDAFVIITGGKINKEKNIHILLKTVKNLSNEKIYVIVFGNYDAEARLLCEPFFGSNIIQLGWIPSKAVYNFFLASDISAFPGTHSVLWEQSCACGLPGIFKDWEGGFAHIDVGGNAILLETIDAIGLETTIKQIIENKEVFTRMKSVAENKARLTFSYMEIAKRAIETNS